MNNHPKNFYYQPSQYQQPFTPEALYYGTTVQSDTPVTKEDELQALILKRNEVQQMLKGATPMSAMEIELRDQYNVLQSKIETVQNEMFRQKMMKFIIPVLGVSIALFAFTNFNK